MVGAIGDSTAGPEDDYRTTATGVLRALLEALPPDGPRDVGLRSAIEQRAAAIDDVVEFERREPSDGVAPVWATS